MHHAGIPQEYRFRAVDTHLVLVQYVNLIDGPFAGAHVLALHLHELKHLRASGGGSKGKSRKQQLHGVTWFKHQSS